MRWGDRIRKREGLFADSFCCYRKSEKFVTVKSSIETDGQPTNLPPPLYGALYKWRRTAVFLTTKMPLTVKT